MKWSLHRGLQVLLFLVLVFLILVYAKPFLVPVTFGALLAMLFLPLSRRMEAGTNRAVANLLCILILVLVFAGLAALLSWQISDIASDADKIEKEMRSKMEQASTGIAERLGIPQEQQQEFIQKQRASTDVGGKVMTGLSSAGALLTDMVLILVYLFLFLYFRDRLRKFVLKLVPDQNQQAANKVMTDSRKVAEKYLAGLAMMIVCLWILYGIGFTIVGVKNALFFAMLCGLLEIVPFIGNIIGTTITVFMVLAQGGSGGMVIGVLATYAIVQSFQSYVLEPLVVGSNVNINPLFTILVLVFGEFVWGLPGMVLAIPVLGIIKIICDHVRPLHPIGYLIGEDKKSSSTKKWIQKIKGKFS